jgi:hypothetical protein
MMAEVVHNLLDCDPVIRLKSECEASDPKYNVMQGEISDDKVLVSEGNALELGQTGYRRTPRILFHVHAVVG